MRVFLSEDKSLERIEIYIPLFPDSFPKNSSFLAQTCNVIARECSDRSRITRRYVFHSIEIDLLAHLDGTPDLSIFY